MCGFVGFVDYSKKSSVEILEVMNLKLAHRGPDDSGVFFENEKDFCVGLAHRRLSIIDLSKFGHQPMTFKNLTIVYN